MSAAVAVAVIVVGVWLALKLAGLAVRLVLWAVVLAVAWWWLAPVLGLPTPF
jgi:hypothetical protein